MNKGRNVLLVFAVLLMISLLSFFTLFERNNTSGIVDDVRYILESEDDSGRVYSFYFVKGEPTGANAYEADGIWTLMMNDSNISYTVNPANGEVLAYQNGSIINDAYGTYSKDLLRTMFTKRDHFLKFFEAAIVFVIVIIGGAVIIYAEEIWHIIHRKGEDVIPEWKDMTPVKIAGGTIIGAAVVLLFVFIFV